jgi:hypothetical protein
MRLFTLIFVQIDSLGEVIRDYRETFIVASMVYLPHVASNLSFASTPIHYPSLLISFTHTHSIPISSLHALKTKENLNH